jgi:hypothetical protein
MYIVFNGPQTVRLIQSLHILFGQGIEILVVDNTNKDNSPRHGLDSRSFSDVFLKFRPNIEVDRYTLIANGGTMKEIVRATASLASSGIQYSVLEVQTDRKAQTLSWQ